MKAQSELWQRPCLFFVIPSLKGGGAERVLITLANHFNTLNFEPVIVSLNYCEPAYKIDEGVKVVYLLDRKHEQLWYRVYYILITLFKLVKLLLKEKPVCVLSLITSANIWTGIGCNITRTPYIVSERTSPNRSIYNLNTVSQRLIASIYKRAAAVVVGAQGVEDCLRQGEAFKNLTNVYKITNAVPTFKPITTQTVHHRKFILGVGRLEYVKGFDQLIEAFGKARPENTDLLLVGDGQESDNLVNLVNKLGLKDRVIFAGSKNNLQDYYSQAHLFVLPSRNEGYPNALVEAMSFGCPCIAMNCEFGPAEIIAHEHNGLLVEAKSIDALSGAITRLINDPLFRLSLGKQAMNINYTNSAEAIFKQWESLVLIHLPQSYRPLRLIHSR